MLVAIILVLWVVLSFTTPAFGTAGSWQPLLSSVAPIALMGVGMTMITSRRASTCPSAAPSWSPP